jgi:hypothetical protein
MSWRNTRKVPLIGVVILAALVLTRLSLMTFWSIDSVDAASPARLGLYWILAIIVLVMLSRFAWQIWTGRHRTGWNNEQR